MPGPVERVAHLTRSIRLPLQARRTRSKLGRFLASQRAQERRCRSFLLLAPARSGTGTTARLLTGLGVPTGHEAWFGPFGFDPRGEHVGDASWLAVPFADAVTREVVLFRQRRNPVDAVASNYRLGWLDRARQRYTDYARHFMGGLPSRPLDQCVAYALAWHDLLAAVPADRWAADYQLESLDAEGLVAMTSSVGAPCAAADAERALAEIPRVNPKESKTVRPEPPPWETVDRGLLAALARAVEAEGYSLDQAAFATL